jgi:L-iditol 2-dehydrogenase
MLWFTGLFADVALLPARIVAGNLHRVPDGLDAATAALADNLACVLKGRAETPGREGERALVLGAGALGLLWTWALARDGARVTVVARHAASLAPATKFGATRTAGLDELERRLASGERFDLVVEAVGSPEAWGLALRALGRGGRAQLFGGPPDGTTVALDARRLHYEEQTLTASFHHTPKHLDEALQLLAGVGPWSGLLGSEPVTLDDLPATLTRIGHGAAAKAVVRP